MVTSLICTSSVTNLCFNLKNISSLSMKKATYDHIPEEIWYEILQWLPSKSLCRFLLVSKPWHRLITSQAFISSQLTRNIATEFNTHMLLRVCRQILDPSYAGVDNPSNPITLSKKSCNPSWEEEYLFYPHDQTSKTGIFQSLGVPSFIKKVQVKDHLDLFKILGSCNGLVCLSCRYPHIILWNPSIDKFFSLPRSSTRIKTILREVYGFGVNLLNGDIKVIRVVQEPMKHAILAEVYSLQTRKWRRVEFNLVGRDYYLLYGPQVYINGRSHWILRVNSKRMCLLVSFDMSDEVFREVSVTEKLAKTMYISLKMYPYRKLAKLVTVNLRETQCIGVVIEKRGSIVIWVMKEYGVLDSWTNIYSIDSRLDCLKFAGFLSNGNVLMNGKEGQLIAYDHLSKLDCELPDINGERLYVDKYVESLILLKPRFNM